MENGLVNLAAIVGLLVFCMGLIPIVLIKGTPSQPTNREKSGSD